MTHLLDSSAFLAFFFGEPGGGDVGELFADGFAVVGVSVLTAGEFWARLKAEGAEDVFDAEWEAHLPLFDRVLPVDWKTTRMSIELRRAATARLPMIDSLIAAAAALHGAELVHRDPHFRSVPEARLKQRFLG